jgi:hypothetical protein
MVRDLADFHEFPASDTVIRTHQALCRQRAKYGIWEFTVDRCISGRDAEKVGQSACPAFR